MEDGSSIKFDDPYFPPAHSLITLKSLGISALFVHKHGKHTLTKQ